MADFRDDDSQTLLAQATVGDQAATQRLLALHRRRLRSMIAMRLDRRLSARVDPSDVLQETLAEAHQKLPEYLRTQPIPFYPWLRQIAWDKIVELHRKHLVAQARAVTREEQYSPGLPDQSALDLGRRLIARGSSPSQHLLEQELKARVQTALGRLDAQDRDVLVLRFLEQLSMEETAAVLGLTPEGVKSRQRRALQRFGQLVDQTFSGDLP
jgi:RNA polymerase sigma-70 factor (ECF subfamily)